MIHEPIFPIASLKGSVKGSNARVFYLHRGIQCSRQNVPGEYRATAGQLASQRYLRIARILWSQLSLSDRLTWDQASRNNHETKEGVPYQQTAYNLFLRSSWMHQAMGGEGNPPLPDHFPTYHVADVFQAKWNVNLQRLSMFVRIEGKPSGTGFVMFRLGPCYPHPNRRPRRWEYKCFRRPGRPPIAHTLPVPSNQQWSFDQLPYEIYPLGWIHIDAVPLSQNFLQGGRTIFQVQVSADT